jgi:hypothetical protein
MMLLTRTLCSLEAASAARAGAGRVPGSVGLSEAANRNSGNVACGSNSIGA